MGRPKSRQAPRTTMSIRVSERERREIEEKAAATGMTPSAYIRTMALESGNVDMTIHDDRQKLMHELSAIGNNINQIARMANSLFPIPAIPLIRRTWLSCSSFTACFISSFLPTNSGDTDGRKQFCKSSERSGENALL